MKNQKGITLIALVVTIIVLLILAGVAIAMLTGNNSILKNASKASGENEYYSAKEQAGLAYSAVATEIKVQVVNDGNWDATSTAYTNARKAGADTYNNVNLLAKIVKDDLIGQDPNTKWVVKYDVSTPAAPVIYMSYTNSAIDKDSISTGAPAEEGIIHFKIEITSQGAKLYQDIGATDMSEMTAVASSSVVE